MEKGSGQLPKVLQWLTRCHSDDHEQGLKVANKICQVCHVPCGSHQTALKQQLLWFWKQWPYMHRPQNPALRTERHPGLHLQAVWYQSACNSEKQNKCLYTLSLQGFDNLWGSLANQTWPEIKPRPLTTELITFKIVYAVTFLNLHYLVLISHQLGHQCVDFEQRKPLELISTALANRSD